MYGALRPCTMESVCLLVSIERGPGPRHKCWVGTPDATVRFASAPLRLLHAVAREPRAVARARAAAHTAAQKVAWPYIATSSSVNEAVHSQRTADSERQRSGWQSSPCERLAWRGASDLHGEVGVFGLARSRLASCLAGWQCAQFAWAPIHTRGWAQLGVWHVGR